MSINVPRSRAATSFRVHIVDWFKHAWSAVKPGPVAWKGAGLGLLFVVVFFILIASYATFLAQPRIVSLLIGSSQFIAIAAIVGVLSVLLITLLRRIPTFYGWALMVALFVLYMSFFAGVTVSPIGMFIFILEVIVVVSLLGAALWVLVRGGWRTATCIQRVITVFGLVLSLAGLATGASWLLNAGQTVEPPPNAAAMTSAHITPLDLPDPSQPGPYTVQTLIYGTGKDRQRPDYSNVDLVTGTVDGSPFTNGWSATRVNYWGFGPDALPINGRVWYPEGAGPFPLVLTVHGDHVMYEFSDPGYDYLGKLLASRGFILVSIDANFLNSGTPPEGRPEGENDARGWLLLEHLRFWKVWNETPGNLFYQRVDMNKIAVMGHSRGGEAAAIAAAFNRLPYYPDDATIAFDYNYNIRSVVAIAPVFGTYQPRGRDLLLENVNYFVLQGSNDQQILSFMGLNQYSRVAFTDDNYWFKTALYIYGANHGQFNTVWVTDQTMPITWLYNQQAVMPFEEQKHIAQVYITAFLEATLQGKSGYIPLFRDHRVAPGWLPQTIYLNQFQDSTYQLVSTYEEDMNAATTTIPGGVQSGQNLTVWREQAVRLAYGPIDNSSVYLGWDDGTSERVASYTIRLPNEGLALDANSKLVFSLADANEDPASGIDQLNESTSTGALGPRQPIDLTIEVVDSAGHAVQLPLSSFSYLQPQIVQTMTKAPFRYVTGAPSSEPVFQSFEFPLADFVKANPLFDPASLTTVRFIFDRTQAGVVILDDVGFRKI